MFAGCVCKRQDDAENTALVFSAVRGQFTMHQFGQFPADRQSKAGTAEAAGNRAVGLGEFLEETDRGFRPPCRCRYQSPRCAAAMRRMDQDRREPPPGRFR